MNNSSSSTHRRVQSATTLNRKYVKRPTLNTATSRSTTESQEETMRRRRALAEQINRARIADLKKAQAGKAAMRATAATTKSPRDAALDSASRSVSATIGSKNEQKPSPLKKKPSFSPWILLAAGACAAVVVIGIYHCIQRFSPAISPSLYVSALNAGFETTYPSYTPKDYSLSDVISEDGKISMTFTGPDDATYTIIEEKSSWDSTALETNFVKAYYAEYTTIREQGLSIFISGSDCTWVNGGILYNIESSGDILTKKQLKSIAVSL